MSGADVFIAHHALFFKYRDVCGTNEYETVTVTVSSKRNAKLKTLVGTINHESMVWDVSGDKHDNEDVRQYFPDPAIAVLLKEMSTSDHKKGRHFF